MPSKFGGIPIESEQKTSKFGGIPVQEQIQEPTHVQEQIQEPTPTPSQDKTPSPETLSKLKSKIEEYGRQVGLTGRYLTEGLASVLGVAVDPVTSTMAKGLGYETYQPLHDAVSKGLSDLGVPEPETETEKLVANISRAMAGAGLTAGTGAAGAGARGISGQVAKKVAAQPAQQIAGGAGAAAGQQAAEEADLGVAGQVAGSLLGGVAGAKAVGKTPTALKKGGKLLTKLKPEDVPEGLAEAEKLGIKVPTADVRPPTGMIGKTFERVAAPAREVQKTQRVEAIKDVAKQYGADEVQPFIDDVYTDLNRKWGKRLGTYAKNKNKVIEKLNNKGVVDTSKTVSKIDTEIGGLKTPSGRNDTLIKQLEDFKTDIKDQDIMSIEAARKRLGDSLAKDPSLAHIKDQGEKITKRLYTDLNNDLGSFISKVGGKRDHKVWKVNNQLISGMNKDLKLSALRSVLKTGDKSPEDVGKLLFSAKPSAIRMLYKNLSPTGRQYAKTTLIQKAIEKGGGIEELSADKFKNQLKRMSAQTNIFFKGADKKVVDGLYKALKYTEQAGKTTATPPTGVMNLPVLLQMGSAGAGAGIAGPGGAALGAIAGPMTLKAASKVYNSKPVRNALIKMATVKPGSKEEAAAFKRFFTTLQDQYEQELNQ